MGVPWIFHVSEKTGMVYTELKVSHCQDADGQPRSIVLRQKINANPRHRIHKH